MDHYKQIRNKLEEYGMDAVLLTEEVNRMYATGFYSMGKDGIALITKKENYYFTDSRYEIDVRESLKDTVISIPADRDYIGPIQKIIEKEGIQTIGFDDAYIDLRSYQHYKESLPCTLVGASDMMSDIRLIKDAEERDCLIQVQRIAERALTELQNYIKVGVTEKELAARLIYFMHIFGGETVPITPGVVAGANGAKPHGQPGFNKIEAGQFVTIDFGTVYHGYNSDMTRTYAVGYVTDEMEKVYNIVLKAQLEGMKATKAGVTAQSVDAVARNIIAEAGYGDCFGHGYGHGIGLEIHEEPFLSRSSGNTILRAGMFTSAEPGIYLPGRFGVRIEDTVEIKEDGCESIALMPKELTILDAC